MNCSNILPSSFSPVISNVKTWQKENPELNRAIQMIIKYAFLWTASFAACLIAPAPLILGSLTLILIDTVYSSFFVAMFFDEEILALISAVERLKKAPGSAGENIYKIQEVLLKKNQMTNRQLHISLSILTVTTAVAPIFPPFLFFEAVPLLLSYVHFDTIRTQEKIQEKLSEASSEICKELKLGTFSTEEIQSEFAFLTQLSREGGKVIADEHFAGRLAEDDHEIFMREFITNYRFYAIALLNRFENDEPTPKNLICFKDTLPTLQSAWNKLTEKQKQAVRERLQPQKLGSDDHEIDVQIDDQTAKQFWLKIEGAVGTIKTNLPLGFFTPFTGGTREEANKRIAFQKKLSFLPKRLANQVCKMKEALAPFFYVATSDLKKVQ